MKFLKHEMLPASWEANKQLIEVTDDEGNTSWDPAVVVALHEIGHICQQWGTDSEGMPVCEVESPNFAFDVLWVSEEVIPQSFKDAVVYPTPCGVHVFAGWEAEYAKDYCAANPEAAYCQPPTPPVSPQDPS